MSVVIGKRTTVGAAITSTAGVLTHFWPSHAEAFIAAAIPVTFFVQMWVARKYGITTGGEQKNELRDEE